MFVFNNLILVLHDAHALVLVGFGFLVTFLRRYGYSAIAINLFLVAFVLELALVVRGFISEEFSKNNAFSIGLKEQVLTYFLLIYLTFLVLPRRTTVLLPF
jgi:ammonium transporter Rh